MDKLKKLLKATIIFGINKINSPVGKCLKVNRNHSALVC